MAPRLSGRLKGLLLHLCCAGLAFSQQMLQTDLKTVLIWDNMQRPLQIRFLPSGQVGCVLRDAWRAWHRHSAVQH
jgi:hypothetical protein